MIAAPTKSAVLINGKLVAFEAYSINDNNYFKLHDMAFALNGTGKQFSVNWDSQKNSIVMTSKTKCISIGGEMACSGNTANVGTAKTSAVVCLDGKTIALTAYTIGGYNYIKLRDLASSINFVVTYDEKMSTISVDTTAGYAA